MHFLSKYKDFFMASKNDACLFFKQFLKNPKSIASIIPSGNALSEALVECAGVESASFIVEIGSGTGVVTEVIKKRASFYSELISIEINKELAEATKSRCPNVDVFCANAIDINQILHAKNATHCDSVVSCIPWVTLSSKEQREVISEIYLSLKDGGQFASFVFLPGVITPSFKSFLDLVEEVFGEVSLGPIIWKNMPPAIIIYAEKVTI